jgi:hypothetical protein
MCTDQKQYLEGKKGRDEYQESMDGYVSAISSIFSSVADACGKHLLHGLILTQEFLRDDCHLISNNTENPSKIQMTTKESTNIEEEMSQLIGPEKLSYQLDTESDNRPLKKNERKNVKNSKTKKTSSEIEGIDKNNHSGPRIVLKQHLVHDNEIRNNYISLEPTNTTIECINQEDIGKPRVKIRLETTTRKVHNSKSLESGSSYTSKDRVVKNNTQYNEQSFNYYWPLDSEHPLNRESYIRQVKKRKELELCQKEQKYQRYTPNTNYSSNNQKTVKEKVTKWKKTHLDQIKIFSDFRNLSYIDYQQKVYNTEIYPTMSQILDKRVPKPPALSTISGVGRGGGLVTPHSQINNNPWQTVGSKQLEKKLGDVFELTSDKYLPKHLPLDSIPMATTQEPTELMMPIVFKISRPRKSEMQINNSRTVAAILAAMQNVFPDTYLIPQNITILDKNIINPLEIPPHDTALSKYITFEPDTPDRTIMARIYMRSNNRLTEYKKDLPFCKYLAREHIVMDEVRLMTINPPTVGFFEDIVPDPDNIKMHTIRLRKHLPAKHPRFQLFVKSLFDSKQRSTKIVVLKCDQCDFDTIHELFVELDKKDTIKFFSWKEFTSLPSELRDTAFQKQLLFNKTYRSVVLSGFRDNEDNVKMIYKIKQTGQIEESEDKKDPLEDVFVTDYIQQWLTAGNGSPLFSHVYEPIEGSRDTMVHIDNYAEAMDYSKIILRELARVMNAPARMMVIADVKTAEEGINKPAWQPYTKAARLIEDRNKMSYYNNKRARIDNNNNGNVQKQHGNPQSTHVKQIKTTPNTNLPKNVWTNSNHNQSSVGTTKTDDTIDEIKAHVLEQIEKNNKVIRDEIHDANQAINKRITNLDKKLDEHVNTVTTQLDSIKEECKNTTKTVESNVDRLENIFWKMWSRFEDSPEPETMDFQKTRDEAALKRSADQVNNNNDRSIDLSLSLSHIDDGVTSNMILTQEETIHNKGSVNNQKNY